MTYLGYLLACLISGNWKEKALKQFVHSLPNVRNPSSLFHVFIHSNAFYLSHILSLIELPYYPHKLRWEIWPEGIEKFQCRLFIQGKESIVDYCLKAKKSNDIIKLCKDHFRSKFYSGLTRENMRCIAKSIYYRELVKMLIQAKKESVTGIITGFKDYISQSDIANLNGVQYLLRARYKACRGKLMNIPCVKVMQAITVEKDESYIMLEATIQSRLGVEIPLKLCIIQAGSNSEKVMDSSTPISDYFTEEPKAEHFHITVYPRVMSTTTLSCLVVGESPYENAFQVVIDTTQIKTVALLKDAIKEKIDDNVKAKDLKLWKVDISFEEENEKLKLVNTKINVNIKEELEGVELKPLSKISKYFTSQPADEHIHIIVQRPVETKEVHCTATYGRKSANFQWTVSREMVSLEGFKKKLCEYFTFPDGTENEHIVIGRVVGGAGLKRKISTGKMRKKLDLASSSSQSASDTVEIVTERKVIQFSADEDLLSIIWTVDPKVDLEIVVDTSQQPFSSYTFPKMKVLFSLKADSYDQLPCIEIGSSATPEEIRNIYPQYEVSGSHGKGPIDWVIKMGDVIISVTEAKREDINQGVAQSSVQAHASLQCNRKKRTYDDADLYEGAMYCIVSTGVDWVITKVQSGIGDGNPVEVFLCSLIPR
ncbi:hypothetical protein GLOIN_2v1571020 [Rhizophagus irregularis DAOM 181602=DAOM 197198]|nr:hypothetical protein GLOIN_2v1571020 [Rhizophagus irregularis DAOM 181602=DAOM 197198]